jgi:hypothetical protein
VSTDPDTEPIRLIDIDSINVDWHRVAGESFAGGNYERAAAAAMIAQSNDARQAYAGMGIEMASIGRRSTDLALIREAEERGARWLLAVFQKWIDDYESASTAVDITEHVQILRRVHEKLQAPIAVLHDFKGDLSQWDSANRS